MKLFEDYIDKRGPDECWPWLGATSNGRAMYAVGRTMTTAARIAWERDKKESFPSELHACHSCDNPICVNPAHIWPGTRSENMRDASKKGRSLKAHCRYGHELTYENLYIIKGKKPQRRCKACQARRASNWYALRSAAPTEVTA